MIDFIVQIHVFIFLSFLYRELLCCGKFGHIVSTVNQIWDKRLSMAGLAALLFIKHQICICQTKFKQEIEILRLNSPLANQHL